MLYLTTHSTHFIYGLFGVRGSLNKKCACFLPIMAFPVYEMQNVSQEAGRKEGRKEMFYLMTHSTQFILQLYGVGHMVKDHTDSDRRNPLPPHGLLFPINSNGSFICTIPHTG